MNTKIDGYPEVTQLEGWGECPKDNTPEERLLFAKILSAIDDFVVAVRRCGPEFWKRPGIKFRNPFAKSEWDAGVEAHRYIFSDDEEDDFSFVSLCYVFSVNTNTIRRTLLGLDQESAKHFGPIRTHDAYTVGGGRGRQGEHNAGRL